MTNVFTPTMETAVIRRYLQALADGEYNPQRRLHGRRTLELVQRQVAELPAEIEATTDPLDRVLLYQKLLTAKADLELHSEDGTRAKSLKELEDDFKAVVVSFSERKGVTYAAWRMAKVPASVLKDAGMKYDRPERQVYLIWTMHHTRHINDHQSRVLEISEEFEPPVSGAQYAYSDRMAGNVIITWIVPSDGAVRDESTAPSERHPQLEDSDI